jgi:AcrR family transcriptional regulator
LSKTGLCLNKNQTYRTTIVQRGCDSIAARDCLFPCSWASDMAVADSSTATRILEEAKNILVEDGFLGLSFRAIAKRTGTTVGNIGYYYGTKDDLMVDLAEYIFDRWEFRLQRDMPPSMTDRREKFRYFIRYMIDQNKQRKTMFLLLEMWAMANRSLAVSKMMDTFYGRLRDSIDGMIADLNPKMAADTRALRAALITTQIEGLMILVGPRKPKHRELDGIEDEALAQIETMALRS